jgi:AraC-like DNA-binding protein
MPDLPTPHGHAPKTAQECTLASHFVRVLVDYCTARGLSAAKIFADCKIDEAVLDDPEQRMGYIDFLQLCQAAANALDDPALGLHLGQEIKPEYLGPYGFALMSSDTPREMMAKSTRYSILAIDAGFNEFVEIGDECIRYWRHTFSESVPGSHLLDELVTASWLVMAREIGGQQDFTPNWVSLRSTKPADPTPYGNLFGCPVTFEAAEYAVAFDKAVLDVPIRHGHPELRNQLDALCEQLLTQLLNDRDPQWLQDCRRMIIESLEVEPPELRTIAAKLDMASGTLRLRLAKCGRTFRGLVDEIRQEMALSYLQNPDLGLVDIAYLLGFSEQSAFQRAFKRWTGHSPGEYRQSI